MKQCNLFVVLLLLLLCSYSLFWIDCAPIVPILTALASSAIGIFQVQIDTLHIAKYVREVSQIKDNRAAFVRDLLYTAFYRSGQGYNVIVFNLSEEHRHRLYGVIFYASVSFSEHTRYGVWVFDYGMFENKGARGWHNWGMIGSFKKSKNGETIYFQQRHRVKTKQSTNPMEILFNFPGEGKKQVKNQMVTVGSTAPMIITTTTTTTKIVPMTRKPSNEVTKSWTSSKPTTSKILGTIKEAIVDNNRTYSITTPNPEIRDENIKDFITTVSRISTIKSTSYDENKEVLISKTSTTKPEIGDGNKKDIMTLISKISTIKSTNYDENMKDLISTTSTAKPETGYENTKEFQTTISSTSTKINDNPSFADDDDNDNTTEKMTDLPTSIQIFQEQITTSRTTTNRPTLVSDIDLMFVSDDDNSDDVRDDNNDNSSKTIINFNVTNTNHIY